MSLADPDYTTFLGHFRSVNSARSEGPESLLLQAVAGQVKQILALIETKPQTKKPKKSRAKKSRGGRMTAGNLPEGISRIDQASTHTHGYFVRVGYQRTKDGRVAP